MTETTTTDLAPGLGLEAATLTLADGRTLRYVHAGEGEPVVVFEAGLGACASEWVTVQRMVSAVTRTVSYDRAGHAGSTPDPLRRTFERICQDLHTLIEEVSPSAPVVLVAHSYGGPIIRSYSERHPGRVAGVVMVDTTSRASMPPLMAKLMPASFAVVRLLHRLGVGEAVMRRQLKFLSTADFPAADLEIVERDLFSARSAVATVAESKTLPESVALLERCEAAGFPPVPVITLVASGLKGMERKMRATKMIPVYEQEMARHPKGECRVIPDAGHFVPQDHPRLTADAVLDVVAAVRAG